MKYVWENSQQVSKWRKVFYNFWLVHFNFIKPLIRSVQLKQHKPSAFSTGPELPNL